MPRIRDDRDYFSGQVTKWDISIPPEDWINTLNIDLLPGKFLQLKRIDGVWHLASNMECKRVERQVSTRATRTEKNVGTNVGEEIIKAKNGKTVNQ